MRKLWVSLFAFLIIVGSMTMTTRVYALKNNNSIIKKSNTSFYSLAGDPGWGDDEERMLSIGKN